MNDINPFTSLKEFTGDFDGCDNSVLGPCPTPLLIQAVERQRTLILENRANIYASFLYKAFGVGESMLMAIDKHLDEMEELVYCYIENKKLKKRFENKFLKSQKTSFE